MTLKNRSNTMGPFALGDVSFGWMAMMRLEGYSNNHLALALVSSMHNVSAYWATIGQDQSHAWLAVSQIYLSCLQHSKAWFVHSASGWGGWWWWWQQYLTNSVDFVDKDAGGDSDEVKWTWEPGSYFISIRYILAEAWKSSKLDAPSLRHQLVHALKCNPLGAVQWRALKCTAQWGIIGRLCCWTKCWKRTKRGLGPKIPPSIGIPSKVRHSAAGPRMADKEQCKCAALHTAHCTLHTAQWNAEWLVLGQIQ